jgi:hypothetical protein
MNSCCQTATVSLFKSLVLSQSMAVPVAAMNALVLHLKVNINENPLNFYKKFIILQIICFVFFAGVKSIYLDAIGAGVASGN